MPGFAHAEEGGMSYSLRVRCDAVMLGGGEVDVSRAKTGKDVLDLVEVLLGCSVFDENLEILYLGKDWLGGVFCSPAAVLEDQHLDHGGSDMTRYPHLLVNASQKLQSLELCKKFGHQR
jgi:hypothetical protein